MAHVFGVAHDRRHRKGRFHHHAVIPFATAAKLEVLRIAFGGVKAGVGQQNRFVAENLDQRVEPLVMGVGRSPHPADDLAKMVERHAPLGAVDPAVIRHAQGAKEVRITSTADGMDQFDAVAVDDAEQGRLGQEEVGPLSLRLEAPKQAGALGQARKPVGVTRLSHR